MPTPLKAKQALLRLVYAEVSATTPAYIHEDAAMAFNGAYQLLWASPKTGYFTEESATVSIVDGTSAYALPASTLKLIGPTRLRGYDLIEVEQYANFQRPALIGLSLDATGTPRIFHLDCERADSSLADFVSVTLRLKPTPDFSDTLTYTASTHPPSFSACDLEVDTGSMPAPQEYFESVILPIARRNMSRSHWFRNKEAVPGIDADYQSALSLLGLLNPSANAKGDS